MTKNTQWRQLLLLVPAILIVLVLFVLPLGRMLISSFEVDGNWSLDRYLSLFAPGSIFLPAATRTVILGAAVTAATFVLGYPIAYLATRIKGLIGIMLVLLVCLPFFTSALVRTYAWQVILANNGPINQFLLGIGIIQEPIQLVYNDIGVVIGMTQVMLPLMVFPLYSTMMSIDRSLVRAARSMGASPVAAWRNVFLPLSMPGVLAGASIVFITTLGYYVTPVLLQGASTPLFAQVIDSLINIPGQSGTIAAQSTLVLLLAIALMIAFRKRLGLLGPDSAAAPTPRALDITAFTRLQESPLGRGAHHATRAIDSGLSAIRFVIAGILGAIGVLIAVLPLVVVVMVGFSGDSYLRFPPTSYSTRWFESYFQDSQWIASTQFSIGLSVSAALIATIVGGLAAFAMARARSPKIVLGTYMATLAPMIVPQIILAVALFYSFIPLNLTGTFGGLLLSYVVVGLPLAVIVLTTSFRGLDRSYERAAASLGASPWKVAKDIVLPLTLPAILSALLFVVFTAFNDLVLAQYLGGVHAVTLERQMFRSIREDVSPQVGAVGTLFFATIVVLGSVAIFGSRAGRKAATARLGRAK